MQSSTKILYLPRSLQLEKICYSPLSHPRYVPYTGSVDGPEILYKAMESKEAPVH